MRSWTMSALFLALAACGGGGDVTADAPPSSPPAPAAELDACPTGFARGDLIASSTTAPDCPAADYDLHADLAYASGPEQLLDLLVPRNMSGPLPVVVWIHGGGWQSGDKTDRAQAERLVCRGYAVAAINYRLSGAAIFPAQIHDVKAAIRFLRARSETYGLDPVRIAAFGSSAGGHLAALAGTSSGEDALEDLTQGNAPVSSRVQAAIDWYGPTRLSAMDSQLLAQGCSAGSARHGEPDSPESRLLGCTLSSPECADQARLADPAEYADAADPPMLLLHGSQDCVSPAAQSTVLAEALLQKQACAVMRTVPTAGHGGSIWHSPEVQDAAADFLDLVLAARAPSGAVANCAAFEVSGDASSADGARWSYQSVDDDIEYSLSGTLFTPPAVGPHPAVVVSHGYGGTAAGYSANIARAMRSWNMVAIATNYTHAPDQVDAALLPQGDAGASDANVRRAHKARALLSCVPGVDLGRVTLHGHSMGAFVTSRLLGTWPDDFVAASHTAGGVSDQGANAARTDVAARIRTPYQLHHGDADGVVALALDQALAGILADVGVPHELHVYPGHTHEQIALDPTMLARVRAWYELHGVW